MFATGTDAQREEDSSLNSWISSLELAPQMCVAPAPCYLKDESALVVSES